MSAFDNFTNQYSLSKTLRFELKPVGKTAEMLKENNVFAIDEGRKKAYEKTKPYFNRLHREFIDEALVNVDLEGLKDYFKALQELKKDRKDQLVQKQIERLRKSLREQIVGYFDQKGQEWATEKYSHLKIKKNNLDILFEEEVFQILKDRYGNEKETTLPNPETEEIVSIFDDWKGFTGYFTKFFDTRKNFYKNDGTSTALSTRIIDQNLDRFLDNIITYNSIKEKINLIEVEKFFSLKAGEVFSVEFYNKCLLQEGIDKYNDFLGGKTIINGEKIRGINEIINKYRQDSKGEILPFLKKLDKQILSERENFIDEIENPTEFLKVLTQFYESSQNKIQLLKTLFAKLVHDNQQFNLKGVYIDKKVFDPYSSRWMAIDVIEDFHKKLLSLMKQDSYKLGDFIPLYYVKKSLEDFPQDIRLWKSSYYVQSEGNGNKGVIMGNEGVWEQFLKIFEFEFFSHFERISVNKDSGKEHKEGYDIFETRLKELLENFKLDKNSKIIIKDFADEVLYIYQMAKYFALEKKRKWVGDDYDIDSNFYSHADYGFKDKFYENAYEEIVQAYNKIRNYLTKKPYSEEKWKLNFDNPTLAGGWDKNKEASNTAIILRKDGQYYLGIMKKGNNQIFDDKNKDLFEEKNGEDSYEKLVYKQIANPAFDIYNLISNKDGTVKRATKKETKQSEWPNEILRIYEDKTYTKDNFNRDDFEKYIDYLKQCALGYWSEYNLKFTPTKTYKNISDLTKEIDNNGYKIWFENVSSEYINQKNRSGDLFLFQIHNKDWNLKDGEDKTGTKNLHTLYFEELFSQTNTKNNFPFKLNGQAEIFYRPKTNINKLGTKKDNSGNEVIDHRRYSENKIFFHVPITLNRTPKNVYRFNTEVNKFLANNPAVNIIGVDRGEKHLAYFSVINQKGEVLESDSLNIMNKVDYHEKLESRAKEREQARKDWQEVEGIKDLKKGYISQVIRKIADLAIKHNAIVVMEDLNMRFKQIRGGIEKSAYQQLEKALIEKLNFLVNKDETDSQKSGHLLKAYQLTAPFETFKDMGKQTGIIFYTQAQYTSKIDPLTGWRPNIYLKYSSAETAQKEILKFTCIKYNAKFDRFEFTYDIKNFINYKEFPKKTEWTICSNVERFRWDKKENNNKGGYIHFKNLTDNFKSLFKEFKIDCSQDIKEQISKLEIRGNEEFFKDFIFYFNLICQIRNTQQDKEGNENDFILSPVEPFFDSRRSKDYGKNLPTNGDENGAYNIARKGVIILNKISEFSDNNKSTKDIKWGDLYVSSVEWDNFATKTHKL